MSYAKRADKNQPELVKAMRDVGAMVFVTHRIGKGFPDCVVLFRGKVYLVEIKTENGTLTEDEEMFMHECEHHGVKYWIVRNVDDCMKMLGCIE